MKDAPIAMDGMKRFELKGSDGKLIRGDRLIGQDRQIVFITGFLSKRWGNKSKALAQWCREKGWGFSCYDVRGFGGSEGAFKDYTLSEWIEDARMVIKSLRDQPFLTRPPRTPPHPPALSLPSQAHSTMDASPSKITLVGNSLGSWIAWLVAQESSSVEELILIAPAFNMMGERAREISHERRDAWRHTGWMPWDDDPLHKDWPLSWQWVEESERYWAESFSTLRRIKTTILHGLQDTVIPPDGSRRFVKELLRRDPGYPIDLVFKQGDHRLSEAEHVEALRRLVVGNG